MNIIIWIIFGGLAGWLGSILAGSDLSLFGNILAGIIGSSIGGWIGRLLDIDTKKQFSLVSFGLAVLGSAVLIILVNIIF